VRFQDISAHLLKPDSPNVEKTFPCLLPDLTIDVADVLVDPRVSARIPTSILHQARIDSVHLSRESFECAIVLQTGHAVIYRLCSELRENIPPKDISDKELIILEHIPLRSGRRYSPFLMIDAGKGRMTAFASSDIGAILCSHIILRPDLTSGFLAAAYGDGLLIVDLRGPRILLRRVENTKQNSKEPRGLHLRHHSGNLDPIGSLTWTISALGTGRQKISRLFLRLILY
jgi:syntaxin-binding protein 5